MWRKLGYRRVLHSRLLRSALVAGAVVVGTGAGGTLRPSGWAATVDYAIDDGTAERAIGIDPGEDTLWFNTFPVQSGGEVIDSISVAYGRPNLGQALNGLNVLVLLYEDQDGGDPFNAVFKTSVNAVTANANTNILNTYPITPIEVHGTFLAAVIFRNRTTVNRFISASDETAPTLPNRSYYGFTVGDMNQSDLSSIPISQRGTLESIIPGNWLVRAHGVPVPEPTLAASFACLGLCGRRQRRA